ncbi:MAG: hypothetical protein HQL54_13910 [Magnetococcales bacterium]|nr:hypothetical protein [Magnetococcales bacterium]
MGPKHRFTVQTAPKIPLSLLAGRQQQTVRRSVSGSSKSTGFRRDQSPVRLVSNGGVSDQQRGYCVSRPAYTTRYRPDYQASRKSRSRVSRSVHRPIHGVENRASPLDAVENRTHRKSYRKSAPPAQIQFRESMNGLGSAVHPFSRGNDYLQRLGIAAFRPSFRTLRDVGMHPLWINVAKHIGMDAFMQMWQLFESYRTDRSCPDRGRMNIPRMHRFQSEYRRYLSRQLCRRGYSYREIVEEIYMITGTRISKRTAARMISGHRD